MQTSKRVSINATVVTLAQGPVKAIQLNPLYLYFLCSKYLRFSAEGVSAADANADSAAETNEIDHRYP